MNKHLEDLHGNTLRTPKGPGHRFGDEMQSVIDTGKTLIKSRPRVFTDGSTIDCEITKFPVFNDDGQVIQVGSITFDITDRKKAEQALQQSEEQFRGAVESLQEGFVLFDANNFLVAFNAEYVRLHQEVVDQIKVGVRSEDLFLKFVKKGLYPEAKGREEEFVRERMEQRRAGTFGTVLRELSNGRSYIVKESRTPNGGAVVTFTDVTDLRKSEERFQTLFEQSNIAIYVHRNFKPLMANPATAKMYVYDSVEDFLKIESTQHLTAPEHRTDHHADFKYDKAAQTNNEHLGIKADGSNIWVRKRTFAIDWDGEPVICSIREDISQAREAADSLQKSEERIRTLFEQSSMGIFVHRNYKTLMANPAIAEMYGFKSVDDFMKLDTIQSLTAPGHHSNRHLSRLKGDEKQTNTEHLGLKVDGTEFWVRKRTFVIDCDGQPAACSIREDISQAKEAEDSLKSSEERFRGVVESLQESFALYDADDRLVMCNDVFRDSHAHCLDVIQPGSLFENMVRENAMSGHNTNAIGRVEEYIQERLERHRNPRGPIVRNSKDGTVRIISEAKMPDSGTTIAQTDVTEIAQAEEEIRKREQLFQSAIASLHEGFALYDADDRLAIFNEEFIKLHPGIEDAINPGMTFEELVKKSMEIDLFKEASEDPKQYIKDRLEQHRNPTEPLMRHTKDGMVQMIKETKMPDGGTVVIQNDITDIMKAEEEIKRQKTLFEAAINNAPYALLMTTMEREVILCNPAFEDMFGYKAGEIIGKSTEMFYQDQKDFEERRRFRDLLDHNNLQTQQQTYKRKNGETILAETALAPIGDPDEKIFGYVAIIQDISGRLRRDEETRQYQEIISNSRRLNQLGEMAAGLAHELNQPLAAITNYTEGCIQRLNNKNVEPDQLRQALTIVTEQADRAGQIIGRIRGFVKKETAKKEPLIIQNVIEEALSMTQSDLEQRNIDLSVNLDDADLKITADKIQIQQVVLNLIRNASDAMEEHGSSRPAITLKTVKSRGGIVKVSVTDTGPGIPSKNINQIFDPFFTTKSEGLGLGLNICQSIIENHGGKMWATSKKSAGASIHFTMPIVSKGIKNKEKRRAA